MRCSFYAKKILKTLFCVTAVILVDRFCHQQTAGFTLLKIQSNHSPHSRWEPPFLNKESDPKLFSHFEQKFTFFSYGGQAYVFLSEDGQTVLKLFKQHHMRIPTWIKLLPLPQPLNKFRNKFIHRREEKLEGLFDSCKIAFDELKEDTGLLYLHLNPTKHLQKKLTLVDKLGIAHTIDLDTSDFLLQRRALLASEHFSQLRSRGDIEAGKESIDSLLKMMAKRSQKGIYDRDPNLRRNCGFISNQAVEIDVGSYTYSPDLKLPFAWKTDVHQKSLQLKRLIQKHYPELFSYLEIQLRDLLYTKDEECPQEH